MKTTELIEKNLSTENNQSIAISRLNGDKPINKSDHLWFADVILSNYGQDCLDSNSTNYTKTNMLMSICQKETMTTSEFREMVVKFISNFKYKQWAIADVLSYREKAELFNEDWYKHQLKTTELAPEHFECFLVEGKKFYCYKADAHKVKITETVKLYRPKRVERQIGQVAKLEVKASDKMISELFQENLELKAKNEQLERKVKQLLLK